jgi:hypothetical protein
MPTEEYEAIHSYGARFFVAPSDEHVWPDLEIVRGRNDRYWIVEKIGRAGDLANSADPRSEHGRTGTVVGLGPTPVRSALPHAWSTASTSTSSTKRGRKLLEAAEGRFVSSTPRVRISGAINWNDSGTAAIWTDSRGRRCR